MQADITPEGDRSATRLERNIKALIERRNEESRGAPAKDRAADAITRFAGSMLFVGIHAVIFGLWILVNLGVLPLIPKFDPSLVILAMVASVEAIFISTFVLISQNRMAEADDKRADLNLQISLMAEQEITKLLSLASAIAEKLEIPLHEDQEIHELQQTIAPEEVLDAIEKKQRETPL
ncbi:DUF1003 domain-containing protein [Rhizobium helianthi]|uniref:DUF1003 domain-containing protein n=1 Tax=Rhizobium helianthi TaxID=1132695 RepID=A0ABW4LYL6_9HYPH